MAVPRGPAPLPHHPGMPSYPGTQTLLFLIMPITNLLTIEVILQRHTRQMRTRLLWGRASPTMQSCGFDPRTQGILVWLFRVWVFFACLSCKLRVFSKLTHICTDVRHTSLTFVSQRLVVSNTNGISTDMNSWWLHLVIQFDNWLEICLCLSKTASNVDLGCIIAFPYILCYSQSRMYHSHGTTSTVKIW